MTPSMKHIIAFILFIVTSIMVTAQKETNNWYFGKFAALNFNAGTPQVLFNSQMNATEGCSSISDKNGNLLFYSDGLYVWNRNHQRMIDPVTGTLSRIGDNSDGTQTGVIIPWPNRDSMYFVFSIGQTGGNLYYSVVNMNRNNGLGLVVITKVLLLESVCEKLTAVTHCNKQDFWAVTHKFNSDQYYSYLITPSGISSSPVISATGNFIINTNGEEWTKTMGYLKNSPDGRLLAAAHYIYDYVELTDFNTITGVISNPKKLYARPSGIFPTLVDGAYGLEFSPDSRLLYVSGHYDLPNDTAVIYQFDVTQPTEASVQASKSFVTGGSWLNAPTALQLGPDKKIYAALHSQYLGIINYPNVQGPGCQFIWNAINLDDGTGRESVFGLPNFIQSFFNDPVIATGNCQFSNINFSLQNAIGISSVVWNFGDPASGVNNTSTIFNPTHIFSQQGQYTVSAILTYSNGCGTDTIYKIVHAGPFQVNLGNDIVICQGDTIGLRMNIPNGSNFWSTGSTDTVIRVSQSGTYWVRVGLGDCTATDTINVLVKQLPAFTLGNDTLICPDQSILLSPSPGLTNVIYHWNTGSATSAIVAGTSGLYWLEVQESNFRCKYRDSVYIQFKTLPNFSLGSDKTVCEKDTVILNAFVSGATGYSWNTGVTSPIISVWQSGIYWAAVSKDGCTFRDSILINVKPLPVVNLGNDTTLCEDVTLVLDAGNTVSQYLWQNNSTSQYFTVSGPGTYYVRKMMNGCISSDTIKISYDFKPAFTLGDRIPICDGQIIQLQPNIKKGNSGISYLWSNGSTMSSISISSPGSYSLELTNYCGTRANEVVVYRGVCKIYVPGAFTPNYDGKNDVFKAMFGENIIKYTLEIYNRWGQRIFQTANLNQGWDGTYNGLLQPNDSYIWIIRYKAFNDNHDQLLKGVVNLVR
jgi:gliding motility-associated-like protein